MKPYSILTLSLLLFPFYPLITPLHDPRLLWTLSSFDVQHESTQNGESERTIVLGLVLLVELVRWSSGVVRWCEKKCQNDKQTCHNSQTRMWTPVPILYGVILSDTEFGLSQLDREE